MIRNAFDKRTHPRVKTPTLQVEYKIHSNDQVYQVDLIDVSAGGMCFLRNAILNKNDQLVIKFPFKTKKVLLTGQVVRVNGREVGVQFENNESDIEKFIETFNNEYSYLLKKAETSEMDSDGTEKNHKTGDIDDALDLDKE